MKINDILEKVNKLLDKQREIEHINTKGHFIGTMTLRKSMGPYKQCTVEISYVNMTNSTITPIIKSTLMERVANNEDNPIIDNTTTDAISKFIVKTASDNNWENIKKGNLDEVK